MDRQKRKQIEEWTSIQPADRRIALSQDYWAEQGIRFNLPVPAEVEKVYQLEMDYAEFALQAGPGSLCEMLPVEFHDPDSLAAIARATRASLPKDALLRLWEVIHLP